MKPRYRDLDLNTLTFDDLRWALGYWRSLCDGRRAPAWEKVDLAAFPPAILPRVCVVDVTTPPVDFRYRFWGTSITNMHHYDLTGKSVRKLTPADYAECIWKQYMRVFETGAPAGFITEVPLERGLISYYAVVRMPLSDDGNALNQVLSAEAYGEQAGELRRHFEELWQAGSA